MYSFGFLTTTAPVTSQVTQPIPEAWVRVRIVFSASSVLTDKRWRWGNAQPFPKREELKPSTVPKHTFLLWPCSAHTTIFHVSVCILGRCVMLQGFNHLFSDRFALSYLFATCEPSQRSTTFSTNSSDKHNIVLKQKEKKMPRWSTWGAFYWFLLFLFLLLFLVCCSFGCFWIGILFMLLCKFSVAFSIHV